MDNLLVYGTPAWKRPQVHYPDIPYFPRLKRQPRSAAMTAQV